MLKDNVFRYTFYLNKIFITNYLSIILMSDNKFVLKTNFGKLEINGNSLRIKKILNKTILIVGNINKVENIYE